MAFHEKQVILFLKSCSIVKVCQKDLTLASYSDFPILFYCFLFSLSFSLITFSFSACKDININIWFFYYILLTFMPHKRVQAYIIGVGALLVELVPQSFYESYQPTTPWIGEHNLFSFLICNLFTHLLFFLLIHFIEIFVQHFLFFIRSRP